MYFDNGGKVHAPYDTTRLAARLAVAAGFVAGDRFVPPRARAPVFGRQTARER